MTAGVRSWYRDDRYHPTLNLITSLPSETEPDTLGRMKDRASTVGELRASGYNTLPVKVEIRQNLIKKLKAGDPLFPTVVGYDDTVLPQITNALLGGQDLILLGLSLIHI